MLKKILFLTIFIFSLSFISAEESLFSFSAGITYGGIVYTDPEFQDINQSIGTPTPLNLGSSLYINLNPIKEITFFLGSDFFFSFNKKNDQFYNHLFLYIPFGVKVYPNLKGFAIGAAYVPGFRKDFIKTENYTESASRLYNWTNGFKFSLEYNFAHSGKSKYLPTVGVFWTCMPRMNYQYDHLFAAYLHANF